MSRSSWLFVGVAVLLGACANGTEDTTGTPGSDGGLPGNDATTVTDDASGSDDAPSQSEDAGGNASDDTGAPNGEDAASDDSGRVGEDAGGDGGEKADSGQPDDDAGQDSSTPDAGHDSGTPPVDAGHDSGTTVDAGHDSGTPPVDSGTDAGTTVDAGHDSGTPAVDAGDDAGCSPPTTPTFTETFHPPPTASGPCSATQVTTFYNDCFAGTGSCTSGKTSCDTCLKGSSSPTGTDWGPFVAYPVSKIDELDLGACLYDDPNATGTTSNITKCADDLEYLTECEHAACDAACSGASLGGYDACQTAADGSSSLCLTEYNNVYGTSSPCANVTSACFGGTDFPSAFTAIAQVMCEP
jgi:hypothetical protein